MKHKFLALWSTGLFCTLVALPYIFALQYKVIAKSPLSLPQLILISLGQTAVLLAAAVFFGLKLALRINLPILELNIKTNLKQILKLSIPLGAATALVIKISDFFFTKDIPELVVAVEQMPFWKAILAAFYGGVVEELLMRLFLVSLFAWLIAKIFKITDVIKNNTIMWVAIILAAIIFGLGHLPATATITQITPLVIVRAILLNGIGGLVFGWLYWKKGLEYAIAAHFTADIVLIALLPALLK